MKEPENKDAEVTIKASKYIQLLGDQDSQERLALLREPFKPHQIGKLPKPTKEQTSSYNKQRCTICGGWHDPNVIHLDYVGHAALTDRLLDVDPCWNWEPLAIDDYGMPIYDTRNGLWIRLTVLGLTRLGYGSAGDKKGGDAIKEIIGDAIRNAAMRFGAALELWHNGDLHIMEDNEEPEQQQETNKLPPFNLELLSSDKGKARIKNYDSPNAAIDRIAQLYTVSDSDAKRIREIWGEE